MSQPKEQKVRWYSRLFGELEAPVFSRLPSGAVIVNPHPVTGELFVVPVDWQVVKLLDEGEEHETLFR
jgi:hypothetical protein